MQVEIVEFSEWNRLACGEGGLKIIAGAVELTEEFPAHGAVAAAMKRLTQGLHGVEMDMSFIRFIGFDQPRTLVSSFCFEDRTSPGRAPLAIGLIAAVDRPGL